MTRPPNAFELVHPRAKPLPPDKQAKPHPRKQGAPVYGLSARAPKPTEPRPR